MKISNCNAYTTASLEYAYGYKATLCLPSGKGTPLILGLFHIHSMLGWFVPMVHVHEGKVGAQSDEYFISRSSR
jgi:hypothetical protein